MDGWVFARVSVFMSVYMLVEYMLVCLSVWMEVCACEFKHLHVCMPAFMSVCVCRGMHAHMHVCVSVCLLTRAHGTFIECAGGMGQELQRQLEAKTQEQSAQRAGVPSCILDVRQSIKSRLVES